MQQFLKQFKLMFQFNRIGFKHFNPLKPNGMYMSHLLQQSITLHFVFWVSYDSHYKRIISSNSINVLIFVMVRSCVFFAVWNEFLDII
jgi:hypothetical protein